MSEYSTVSDTLNPGADGNQQNNSTFIIVDQLIESCIRVKVIPNCFVNIKTVQYYTVYNSTRHSYVMCTIV